MTETTATNGAAAPSDAGGKLAALRKLMAAADGGQGVHAYIVPSEDPHMSEYPTDADARRQFISGFTGSAGTAVVTGDSAMLWTDGRYWLQAGEELGEEWTLMKMGHPDCPEIPDWLADNLPTGARVGIDPFCHTVDAARRLASRLEDAGKALVPLLGGNLVDGVWEGRPPLPKAPMRVHALEFAGTSVADKLARMRTEMAGAGAGALLVTGLDEVAWLTNLRGSDVSYNPVFVSYAIVTAEGATLFVDPEKVNEVVGAQLKEAGVEVKPYGEMVAAVQQLARDGTKMWIDPAKVSFALYEAARQALEGGAPGSRGKRRRASGNGNGSTAAAAPSSVKQLFVEKPSPVTAAKAVKNDTELAGMAEAHIRDGVALAHFISWLEKQVASGAALDEVDIDAKLNECRAAQQGFVEPSFPTIAGANAHGAIIHYRAQRPSAGSVGADTLLLLDSGGQYECGTTDITRTMHFGTPSEHQKTCYTRVLQGHIALDRAVFPEGTPGLAIDTLARMPLWNMGLNYRHGTGHGVGAALNVHEGPMSISTRYAITTPLSAGMVVSNEPGYYEDGAFGIRIENLVTVVEAPTPFRFGGQAYFKFQALTMCPIQTKLIDLALLSPEEIGWLNSYHQLVWEKISPRLEGDALEWLKANTQPVAAPVAASA